MKIDIMVKKVVLIFELIGLLLQLSGAMYAIMNKFSIFNKLYENLYPFRQIKRGLEKLTHKTIDDKLKDNTLYEHDEGFKELKNIINKNYGPIPNDTYCMYFDYVHKQRTVETSTFNLILTREKERIPVASREKIIRDINTWIDNYLVTTGFFLVFYGTLFQIIGAIIQFFIAV